LARRIKMADFTSTQLGDWNDGAQWGGASPGVKGVDWPGNPGDTTHVGHAINYNVSEANELGDMEITAGGLLSHQINISTKLCFGNNTLTVKNTGEYRVGAAGAIIDKAVTAELSFNTTSDNSKGVDIDDGGKLTVYGDPEYYGGVDETTLANDAENTDNDADIVTTDDMSAKWNIGDEITILRERDGDSSSYKDAVVKFVITNIVGTTISLDANFVGWTAGIGNTWTAPVVNVSRNVMICKAGADTVCGDGAEHYNTNRPRIYDVNASGNNNCIISDAQITGLYSIQSSYDFQLLSSVFRNGYYGINSGSGHTVNGNIYANYYAVNSGSGHTVSGNVYANYYAISSGYGHTVNSNIYANNYGFYSGSGHTVSGNIYTNNYGFYSGYGQTVNGNIYTNKFGISSGYGQTVNGNIYANTIAIYYCSSHTMNGNIYANDYGIHSISGLTMNGRIGYDSLDASQPNTVYDFYLYATDIVLFNVKLPLAGLIIHANQAGQPTEIFCEHHDRTLDTFRIYQNMGNTTVVSCDGVGDRPSEDPDGGNGEVIELSNIQSNCSDDPGNRVKAWKDKCSRVYALAADGMQTYTFKLQTTYSTIGAGGVRLTAEYLDGVSGGSTSEVTDDSGITERANAADWTQSLSVNVTPAEDGWVDFKIELYEYESGDEVWIWPEVAIT
jgi:hypothetical protein